MCDSKPPSDLPLLVNLQCKAKGKGHKVHWAKLSGCLVEWAIAAWSKKEKTL